MPSHPSKRIKKAIASRPKPQNRKKPKLRKDPKGATGSMRRDRSSGFVGVGEVVKAVFGSKNNAERSQKSENFRLRNNSAMKKLATRDARSAARSAGKKVRKAIDKVKVKKRKK